MKRPSRDRGYQYEILRHVGPIAIDISSGGEEQVALRAAAKT